ncbi:hypothetical protein BGZ76_011038 [Entomortierella beljakovae]|nr:hypothetical protein BGZ76_011038 [Entomortierella beljakovae]
MFIKYIVVAILVITSFVEGTIFTSPIRNDLAYLAGSQQTFTWSTNCIPPSTNTSPHPKSVRAVLVDNTNPGSILYITDIATIDCSIANQNTVIWTVPNNLSNYTSIFALALDLTPPSISGRFKVIPVMSDPTPSSKTPIILGSVIGVVVLAIIIAIALIWRRRRRRTREKISKSNTLELAPSVAVNIYKPDLPPVVAINGDKFELPPMAVFKEDKSEFVPAVALRTAPNYPVEDRIITEAGHPRRNPIYVSTARDSIGSLRAPQGIAHVVRGPEYRHYE